MVMPKYSARRFIVDDNDIDLDVDDLLTDEKLLQVHFDKVVNIATRETSALFDLKKDLFGEAAGL